MIEQIVEIREAFDEERALARIKELTEQRDEGKGIVQDAILALGQMFMDVRSLLPGVVMNNGQETYSPKFLAFIDRAGYAKSTAWLYMSLARNPTKLAKRYATNNDQRRGGAGGAGKWRLKTLTEIRDVLITSTREEVLYAINQELADAKAPFTQG